VHARAWGSGAEWALDRLPSLLGADDDPTGFVAHHPQVAAGLERHRHWRIGRTGLVMESLVPSILEQKVTGKQAFGSFRELVRRHGEPAPGPVAPLRLIAPVLGIHVYLRVGPLLAPTGAILLGTPRLSGIGAIGAALTLGLRGGGVLVSLLVLPLYIPVLIFGAGAVDATVAGLGGEGHLSLLAALTFASLGFAPWATAAALKIALE